MIHNFQKRWVFTWNADLSDQIIEVNKLKGYFKKNEVKRLIEFIIKVGSS